LVPWDCSDGFLAAYWRRPERYLDLDARNAISSFQQIPEAIVSAAILRLKNDVESGAWAERYSDLWERDAMDFGYRLVVSGDAAEQSDARKSPVGSEFES
jgi:hypothetical protein